MNSILLIQSDSFVAHYLRNQIEAAPSMRVSRTVANLDEAKAAIPIWRPDVIVGDLPILESEIVKLCELRGMNTGTRPLLMVIAASGSDERLVDAIRLGCDGYYDPSQRMSMAGCLERLLCGESAMSPRIAQRLKQHFEMGDAHRSDFVSESMNTLHLEPAERVVLQWMASGRVQHEVAHHLSVSVRRVGLMVRAIYRKLQLDVQAGELTLAS